MGKKASVFEAKIRAAMKANGWTQQDVAQRIEVSQATVHRWLTGTEPEGRNRDALLELIGETGSKAMPAEWVSFAGIAQAGVFVDVDLHTNDHPRVVAIAPDPRYRLAKQYAWLVKGDSMDRAGLRDGMWALGVDFVDFADRYRDVENGDVVVVERLRFDGQERELTIKRYRREKAGFALVPDSTNPAHKAIFVPADDGVVGEQIRILAVVAGAYTLFGKPFRDLDEGG